MNSDATKGSADFVRYSKPHWNTMYRLALQMTRNQTDADDVVQSALLRALKYFPRFLKSSPDPERNVRLWLLKITRNAFLDSLTKKSDWESLESIEADTGSSNVASEPQASLGPLTGIHLDDAAREFFQRTSTDEIQRALESLNPVQRSILFLTIEEYTTHEIAEILNIATGTVLSARARALGKLRHTLS